MSEEAYTEQDYWEEQADKADDLLEKSNQVQRKKPNQRQGGMLGSEDSVRLGKSPLLVNPSPAPSGELRTLKEEGFIGCCKCYKRKKDCKCIIPEFHRIYKRAWYYEKFLEEDLK